MPLNPNAREWDPIGDRAPESMRSLFVTFSNGHHLTGRQIRIFFDEMYGRCVERVYLHWPAIVRADGQRMPPLYGKVVFRGVSFPVMVLGGHNEVRFIVDGKNLWCKRYEPRRRLRNAQEEEEEEA